MESYFVRSLSSTPFTDDEDMKYEFRRLTSFTEWPENSPVYPTRLAQAGFFHKGPEDNVQCYKCKTTKSDWKFGESPLVVHERLNKDCAFLRSGEDNIPIQTLKPCHSEEQVSSTTLEGSEKINDQIASGENTEPLVGGRESEESATDPAAAANSDASRSTELQKVPDNVEAEQRPSSGTDFSASVALAASNNTLRTTGATSSAPVTANPREESSSSTEFSCVSRGAGLDTVTSSTPSTISGASVATYSNSADQVGGQAKRSRNVVDSSAVPRLHRNASSPSLGQGKSPSSIRRGSAETAAKSMSQGRDIPPPMGESLGPLRYERNRLETFRSWPSTAKVTAAELARSGFYYTGSGDRVQCVFCKGILRNWEEGDRPHIEHRKHFPRCSLVLGLDVGNIPQPLGQNLGMSSQNQAQLVNFNVIDSLSNMEALGINTDRPKHPQYAVEATRLSTYQNWPSYKQQTPQGLAEAGFFYAGFSDNVKCFYCDGGLRNWEKGDDPWQEHARWFPRCPFVLQVKGQEFVTSIQQETPVDVPILAQIPATGPSRGPRAQAQVLCPGLGRHFVEDREVRARMDRPMVQLVLNMNVSRDIVMAVIRKRLEETGDDFPNAQALVEAVFEYQEKQNRGRQLHQPSSGPGEVPATASTSRARSVPSELNTEAGMTGQRSTSEPSGANSETTSASSSETEKKSAASATDVKEENSPLPKEDDLLRENMELKEQRLCKICMVAEANVVFLPCAHLVSCAACAPALRLCPICRANIKGTIRTYLS